MSSQVFRRRHPAAATRQIARAVTAPTALCRQVLYVTPSTPLVRHTELRRPSTATRRCRRSHSSCTRSVIYACSITQSGISFIVVTFNSLA